MTRRRLQAAVILLLAGFCIGGPAADAWAQAPTAAEVYVGRAILAFDDKRYDVALAEVQEALRLDPDNVTALYYLGLISIATDRFPEARAALEKARRLRPTDLDVAFQLGVLHFNEQRYAEADPPLRTVFEAQPRRPNLGFYLGFMAYRRKEYREALRFLRANVPSDASFAQLNSFYTALTLGALQLPAEAREEMGEAIRLNPASPLASPGERFRGLVEPAARRERRFQGEVRIGVFYDDNVAVVPNPSSDLVARVIREQDRRSEGEMAALRLAYTWLRTADWEATVSYAFLQTINNRLSDFNVQDHTGTVGLTYRSAIGEMPYFAGLQVAYDYITLGGDRFVQRPIFQPFFTLVEGPGHTTSLVFRTQLKDFRDANVVPAEVRDATNYMGGAIHFFRFAGDRHYIKVGYQYDVEDADGDNWSYVG
ncbi:MAG TPA: tetratricopeptide repeat protein, partial [Anaerolineales bacterium]